MDTAVTLVAVVGLVVLGGATMIIARRSGLPLRSGGRRTDELERDYLRGVLRRHEADLRKQGYTDEDVARELEKKRDDLVKLAPEIEGRMREQGFTDAQIQDALRVVRQSFPAESADDPYAPAS
jgi:hypothetical protein